MATHPGDLSCLSGTVRVQFLLFASEREEGVVALHLSNKIQS